jgi:FixJ family two-component response regulator
MPGLGGPRVAEQLILTRPETKVIYLSGYSEEAVATLGQLGQGAVLLSKPFAADMLLRTVHKTLGLHPPA